MFFRMIKFSCLSITAATLFSGCATPGFTPTLYYSVQPIIEVDQFESSEAIIGLRPLSFQGVYRQHMLFREPGQVLRSYSGTEWAEAPNLTVFRTLLDALTASERFADVDNTADLPRPDFILLGSLRKFEEDRTRNSPVAVVEARLVLRRGDDRSLVWSGVVHSREPLTVPGPSGYAEAMSKALGRWASEAAEKIAAAVD